jgi:hypothetical protein
VTAFDVIVGEAPQQTTVSSDRLRTGLV